MVQNGYLKGLMSNQVRQNRSKSADICLKDSKLLSKMYQQFSKNYKEDKGSVLRTNNEAPNFLNCHEMFCHI